MLRVILLPVLLMSAAVAGAEEVDLVARLLERVQHLREVLGPELSGKMLHEFDEKGRTEWSFFPGEHPGVAIGACTEEQQAALLEVLRVALSASGFEKTELVRGIDDVLGKTDGPQYTSGNYFLSVWGEPGAKGPWSLRWEGHHISLHWLIRDGRVMASTPQFLGSHPALVEDEGPLKGVKPQAQEEALARALVTSLDEAQAKVAIAGEKAFADVITHSRPQVERLEDAGIAYGALSPEQQEQLRALIQVYIDVQAGPVAEQRAKALTPETLAEVKFAWYGATEPGQKHYYRIQAPGWVIEYANTQHNVNHIHTTWRDFGNDFGRDVLREHLAMAHAEAGWEFGLGW